MKLAKLGKGPEIFASIQGEGRNQGLFSVFVRTSLCNLHCVWCDTDYTWNWIGTPFAHVRDIEPGYSKFDQATQIIDMSPERIADVVVKLRARNVVITGGEPLLQQSELVDVMRVLRSRTSEYAFETETNGTLVPTGAFDALVTQYNVSPKLENSNNTRRLRIRRDALEFFAQSPKAWFKFACAADDVSEVDRLVAQFRIRRDRVFLLPLGSTTEDIRRQSTVLVDRCLERGFNFSDRLHIHLFKNRRGT